MNAKVLIGFLSGALAASLGLNAMLALRAGPPAATAPGGDSRRAPKELVRALALTPAQIQQLETCCSDCCAGRDTTQTDLADAARELETELARDELDRDKIRALARRVGELRASRVAQCAEAVLAVRDVLTPEQLETLISLYGEEGRR
jgi:Spy/CpxP family protein refolding chaperone